MSENDGRFEGPRESRLRGGTNASNGGPEPERMVRRSPQTRITPLYPRGTATTDGRSMVDLLRQLSNESGNLMRQEIELAKAEMRQKMGVFQQSMVSIGIGAVLLVGALLTFLWALNTGLTALLAQIMSLELAVWLSPLILTAALAACGWALLKQGRERMADEGLVPRRTATALREDTRWAGAKVHEIKEELTHGR